MYWHVHYNMNILHNTTVNIKRSPTKTNLTEKNILYIFHLKIIIQMNRN